MWCTPCACVKYVQFHAKISNMFSHASQYLFYYCFNSCIYELFNVPQDP